MYVCPRARTRKCITATAFNEIAARTISVEAEAGVTRFIHGALIVPLWNTANRDILISASAHSPRCVARVREGEIPGAQLVQHPQDCQARPDGVAPLDPYETR